MLELARASQFVFIDCFVLSFKFVSQFLGPWVTMFCLQSKGWPFVAASWGLWDLLLLHGNGQFQRHWLYFTGIKIYASGNSGSWIIASDNYTRILLSMIIAGFLATLKNTILTLYFGRRMFDMYIHRLEDILNDIITISEIAELSVNTETIANAIGLEKPDEEEKQVGGDSTPSDTKTRISTVRWSDVTFKLGGKDSQADSDADHLSFGDADNPDFDEAANSVDFELGNDNSSDDADEQRAGFYDSSSRLPIKELLDRWDEEAIIDKRDKSFDASVNDLLKFRRAITYMNLDYPFSEAFGKASTRNEMILSAEAVYDRLMMLSPGSTALPGSVFKILFLNQDGTEDKEKKRAIGNLLRPDGHNNVPLVSFVQSCDTVYKRLRYFRASVGNSSVIDHVLESIINAIFYFALGLLVLSLLKLNPWPLLVSTSTLLVAGSFAVGPSCAKAVEGILVIVGRRPYDIGDRIIITNSPGGEVPPMSMSWIVEDISLFSTTLRHNASNEISTVSNASIAGARITNCARSKNAIVHMVLKFHISCHKGSNTMARYKEGVEAHIHEMPNIWDSIFFFRCEDIDPDKEEVTYRLAVRSRYTWQLSSRVLQYRGELHQFCVELAFKFGINYNTPNPRSIMYYGGSLLDGGVKDYKTRVLKNDNIQNNNEIFTGLVPNNMALSLKTKSLEEKEAVQESDTYKRDDTSDVSPTEDRKVDPLSSRDKKFLSMIQEFHE